MNEPLKSNQPLVSIITVNFNGVEVTIEMLESLRKLNYPNVEVIVVDNASTKGDARVLKQQFPEIQLILAEKNLGFAGGNNLGVRAAKGEYLLFLNNDTTVPSGLIEPLVELFQRDSQTGMVSPKIKFEWDPGLVQYAGFSKMNPYTIRNVKIGLNQPDDGRWDELQETEAGHGAAMMVSREVVEKVGMMPEVYFLYYEEHDWAEMIKRAGYKIYYQPATYILHKESVATGKDSPFKVYYVNRSRMIFARRNGAGIKKVASLLFQVFVAYPKNSLVYIKNRQIKHLAAYWKALGWNLLHRKAIFLKNNL